MAVNRSPAPVYTIFQLYLQRLLKFWPECAEALANDGDYLIAAALLTLAREQRRLSELNNQLSTQDPDGN